MRPPRLSPVRHGRDFLAHYVKAIDLDFRLGVEVWGGSGSHLRSVHRNFGRIAKRRAFFDQSTQQGLIFVGEV